MSVQVATAELSEAQTAVIRAMNRAGMPSCLHERLSWPSGLRLASFVEIPE
jgi:hypothetical protein